MIYLKWFIQNKSEWGKEESQKPERDILFRSKRGRNFWDTHFKRILTFYVESFIYLSTTLIVLVWLAKLNHQEPTFGVSEIYTRKTLKSVGQRIETQLRTWDQES